MIKHLKVIWLVEGALHVLLCYKSTTEEFIKKAKKVHPGDNYDYSRVEYKNAKTKVMIGCKKHNIFFDQNANDHLCGRGCNKCGREQIIIKQSLTLHEFIKRAVKVHGNKYDYAQVEYMGIFMHVKIKCKKHQIFFNQSPHGHLAGKGCIKCCIEYNALQKTLTTEQFIEKAILVHGDKFDYTKTIYINAVTQLTVGCKLHGEFSQTATCHLNSKYCCYKCRMCPSCGLWQTYGRLCPYCKPKNQNKLYQKTKEIKIVTFLKEKLPDEEFIHNKSVGKDCTNGHLFPDILFQCSYYNIIIEIDEHKHRGASYKCDEQRMYDIIAKLGLPCVFIRYNPDHKDSDKYALLENVQEYLEMRYDEEYFEECTQHDAFPWDSYGYRCEYMYYY